MPSAIGGFATGLTQGLETGQKIRRNRQIEKLIDREMHEKDIGAASRRELAGLGGADLSAYSEFEQSPDPFLIRGFNWLRNKFGEDASQAAEQGAADPFASPVTPQQAIPAGEFNTDMSGGFDPRQPAARALPEYADGGMVDDEEYNAGGLREFVTGDLPRRARAIPDTLTEQGRRIGEEVSSVGQDLSMRARAIGEAEDPYAAGSATREFAGELGLGTARVLGAGAREVLGPLAPAAKGVLGFLGFRGEQKSRRTQQAGPPPTADTPEAAALADKGGETPAEQVAANATEQAGKTVPGHPDNDDQKFDWEEVAAQGVRPEEIPHVGTGDWKRYRQQYVAASVMGGKSPAEAHAEVDQIQNNGMLSNMRQASYLLQASNPKAAALALRAAYQYFPNGADVTFGVMQGPQGPVLVGMGKDERTGEPLKGGKPMVITAERLNMMAENFSNPAAMRLWAKDMDEQMFKERQYQEVDKPTAQADLGVKAAQADYYRASAADKRAGAAGGGQPALKQADYDRAYKEFIGRQELTSIKDPKEADYLADVMSRLYQRNPSTPYPSIVNLVMQAYEDGTLEEGLAEIGLR
jgi:hypothetical protein